MTQLPPVAMKRLSLVVVLAAGLAVPAFGETSASAPAAAAGSQASANAKADQEWAIYIANDNCPDITWGFTQEQTYQAFTDLIAAHLDEMTRTDDQPWYNQDRYNAAVASEVLAFVERHPERKDELIRRIKEGRLFVSPYLCNTMWAFQSFEGALRSFYPARQLERDWGIPFKYGQHIEMPSLPWGQATILAGCGIRGVNLPYLKYDSYFPEIHTPPLFQFEGPDGSRVAFVVDHFASQKGFYMQGSAVLRNAAHLATDWLANYESMKDYPARVILAAGTHGDINPNAWRRVKPIAEQLIAYNAKPDRAALLVNATYTMFFDKLFSETPMEKLPVVRGDFGHAWDLWPVSLSRLVSDARMSDRELVAGETVLAAAAAEKPEIIEKTAARRRRASKYWGLVADHAWNGTDDANRRHNAGLRRLWTGEMHAAAADYTAQAWEQLAPQEDSAHLSAFNPLSVPRRGLISLPLKGAAPKVKAADGAELPSQIVWQDDVPTLCFVTPEMAGFGFAQFELVADPAAKAPVKPEPAPAGPPPASPWAVQGVEIETPFYKLKTDPRTGGIGTLIHKPSGREVVDRSMWRTLLQPVYSEIRRDNPDAFINSTEDFLFHPKTLEVQKLESGPVLTRLLVALKVKDVEIKTYVTLYNELDQVDFDSRIHKTPTGVENRLLQYFPIVGAGTLRVACTGAVIRPYWAPQGDMVPGADVKRFAVQEFINASGDDWNVTVAPNEPYLLRMDLGQPAFEPFGCDQNYREVTKDQDGDSDFRARYSLRASQGGYNQAASYAFAGAALQPLLWNKGPLAASVASQPLVVVDSARAIATDLKPAENPDEGGLILRLREVAGTNGPLTISVNGFQKAVMTDLLERDLRPLAIDDGKVTLEIRGHGFASVRLVP